MVALPAVGLKFFQVNNLPHRLASSGHGTESWPKSQLNLNKFYAALGEGNIADMKQSCSLCTFFREVAVADMLRQNCTILLAFLNNLLIEHHVVSATPYATAKVYVHVKTKEGV